MNKRKRNKLYKNTLIKIKKLHPQKGDMIVIMPDFEKIDFEVAYKYFKALSNEKFLKGATFALSPCPIKSVGDKEAAQKFVDALQEKVNKMEE